MRLLDFMLHARFSPTFMGVDVMCFWTHLEDRCASIIQMLYLHFRSIYVYIYVTVHNKLLCIYIYISVPIVPIIDIFVHSVDLSILKPKDWT